MYSLWAARAPDRLEFARGFPHPENRARMLVQKPFIPSVIRATVPSSRAKTGMAARRIPPGSPPRFPADGGFRKRRQAKRPLLRGPDSARAGSRIPP
nr:hypothetical protein [Bacillaceae bacterium]